MLNNTHYCPGKLISSVNWRQIYARPHAEKAQNSSAAVNPELCSCSRAHFPGDFRAIGHFCPGFLRATAHFSAGSRACFVLPLRAAAHPFSGQPRIIPQSYFAAKFHEEKIYVRKVFAPNQSSNSLRKTDTNQPPPDH
jgi:hypothetical protein